MNDSKLTVILPNYNKADYIAECLTCLLDQTHSDWVCYAIDGFSEDGSWETLQSIAAGDRRFRLLQLEPTGNCYDAWNIGLSKVNSPYFCVLTSDDRWDRRWLELAIDSLDAHPAAIAVASAVETISASGLSLGRTAIARAGDRFFEDGAFEDGADGIRVRSGHLSSLAAYFLGAIYISFHGLVVRSPILEAGFAFDTTVGAIADYDAYLRLGLWGDILYRPDVVNSWRRYDGQLTNPKQQRRVGRDMIVVHQRWRKAIADCWGDRRLQFLEIAEEFDEKILAYHYDRPCFANLMASPRQELPHLLRIIFQKPGLFWRECVAKSRGQSFFLEAGLQAARFLRQLR